MQTNVIAVSAGKGGVMKTTVACHLAGIAAASGWRVLLVDADPQGNAMFDLGYESDGGAALAAALRGVAPLRPLPEVRPGLDVVPGGPSVDSLGDGSRSWFALDAAVAPVADDYDLIVVDSPARELWLRRMILTAARYVVVPSGVDRASRVGLADLASTIREVRSCSNPELDVLGVVAGPVAATATQVRARARGRLGELIGDPDLVCDTVIRHSVALAELCRERGVLVTEFSDGAVAGGAFHGGGGPHPSCAAASAAEWRALTAELIGRFVDASRVIDLTAGVRS